MPTFQDFLNHPIETLERALHLRKQIDHLNETLREIFGPTSVSLGAMQSPTTGKRRGRSKRSAATRAKMAAAQQARWAKQKGTPPAPKAKKKKGGMSAEGRARIIAAQKKRWAKVKAEKSQPAAAPVKTKRKISAAHRAKLAASAKARWAKVKKGASGKGRTQIAEAGQPKFKIF